MIIAPSSRFKCWGTSSSHFQPYNGWKIYAWHQNCRPMKQGSGSRIRKIKIAQASGALLVITIFKMNIGALHLIIHNINWMAPGKNHVTAISTEIFKYVRIHPNFASRPVWCEKMFLCCFSLKAGRKDLTNRPKVLSCFLPCSTGFLISRV